MDTLTREEKRDSIRRAIDENGRRFVVSAMVDGTNGFRSPGMAEQCIDRFLEGEDNDYSERCVALYEFDLVEMMYDDIASFTRSIEEGKERVFRSRERAMAICAHGPVVPLLDPTMEH
jgi:hypothetical protein